MYTEEMQTIPFSNNWNNKLDCSAFTTIRIAGKWKPGQRIVAVLKGQDKGTGHIEAVKSFLLKDLNSFMAFIDTGYSLEETTAIIRKMYPTVNFDKVKLDFILIVKDKK